MGIPVGDSERRIEAVIDPVLAGAGDAPIREETAVIDPVLAGAGDAPIREEEGLLVENLFKRMEDEITTPTPTFPVYESAQERESVDDQDQSTVVENSASSEKARKLVATVDRHDSEDRDIYITMDSR